jgi:hypothetical protein
MIIEPTQRTTTPTTTSSTRKPCLFIRQSKLVCRLYYYYDNYGFVYSVWCSSMFVLNKYYHHFALQTITHTDTLSYISVLWVRGVRIRPTIKGLRPERWLVGRRCRRHFQWRRYKIKFVFVTAFPFRTFFHFYCDVETSTCVHGQKGNLLSFFV